MADAGFQISATLSNLPEMSSGTTGFGFVTTFNTTQAVGNWIYTTATTPGATAAAVSVPSSVSVIYMRARDSTNNLPFRFSFSSADTGIVHSSRNPSLVSIATAIHSTLHIWTTGTTVVPVRIGFF